MSDENGETGPETLARPEEEASRLQALAAEAYTSGDLKAAAKHAKQAHKLHPSLNGLPEMLAAFTILRTAAEPISAAEGSSVLDYYQILGVEQFSHINTIKKHYKKLAMTLHPDKNPFAASEEAFKLVGEAARVLSDRIRRKEYDTRLRVALQSKSSQESELTAGPPPETFWTPCTSCRRLHQFERKYLGHNLMCPSCKKTFTAVEAEDDSEKNGCVPPTVRASARIRERIARGDGLGIVEKCGLGMKRRIAKVEVKATGDVNPVEDGGSSGGDNGSYENGLTQRVGEETMESEKAKKAEAREDATMTLSELRMLTRQKKKKLDNGEGAMRPNEIDVGKSRAKKKKVENSEGAEEKDLENVENEDTTMAIAAAGEEEHGKEKNADDEIEIDRNWKNREANGKATETRGKRERQRSSKLANLEALQRHSSKNQRSKKKDSNVEMLAVEDADFHDFDVDRHERSFKKGQVWAVYDESDGMPRHYAVIDQIESLNPFKVMLSWLEVNQNHPGESMSQSCGSFKISNNVSIQFVNLFSHIVDCERAARQTYRIYPKKGSIWALYGELNRKYDIVVCLRSYSDMHGTSLAYLEKVEGFKAVFKRRSIGANAVVCLRKDDMRKFSHRIPAKKLSGDQVSGILDKDCWELDPAALPLHFLGESL
ncbi:uncharacterized protein LOC127250553 [Andrographis paniculata]|uniref:uncharacterized protein LOC127250553 n=1 Tax=Andrographis paniculata TaxID=175694 RepID=UPI0021E98A70|nr:uncharacterized protein LOC127250553 [Andrographis paniculata]